MSRFLLWLRFVEIRWCAKADFSVVLSIPGWISLALLAVAVLP